MATYTALDGALRLYDSAATPFYIQVLFDEGNLSFPEGRARPEETPTLHRGRATTATVHNILGPDTPTLEPQELSFSFRMQNSVTAEALLIDALCNPRLDGTWQVGSVPDTWTTTKGDATLTNGAGVTFTDPDFADPEKVCVNVEILWTRSAVSVGRLISAVYFPADQISLAEAEDGVIVSVTGQIYGTVSGITAFTAGTESTA